MLSVPMNCVGRHWKRCHWILVSEGGWEQFHNEGGVMSDKYVDAVEIEARPLSISLEPQCSDVSHIESKDVLAHLNKTDKEEAITSTTTKTREPIPTREKMTIIIRYFFETHTVNLFVIQNHMFTNVNPHNNYT